MKKKIIGYIISFVVVIGLAIYFKNPVKKETVLIDKENLVKASKDTVKINTVDDSSLYKILLDTNSKSRQLLDSLIKGKIISKKVIVIKPKKLKS